MRLRLRSGLLSAQDLVQGLFHAHQVLLDFFEARAGKFVSVQENFLNLPPDGDIGDGMHSSILNRNVQTFRFGKNRLFQVFGEFSRCLLRSRDQFA